MWSVCSTTGSTSTPANEVWRRPWLSKGEMRTSRWVPCSTDACRAAEADAVRTAKPTFTGDPEITRRRVDISANRPDAAPDRRWRRGTRSTGGPERRGPGGPDYCGGSDSDPPRSWNQSTVLLNQSVSCSQ
ncbi:hypothetical protein SHIRM173S_08041 [Streptomyces hirsutus]